MATSLSQLRKSKSSMLDKIVKDLDSGGSKRQSDDRFWSVSRDKAGNGSAVLRILPPMNGDELPWVKEFSYGWQGKSTGKWFIELSPTTIGLPDPVAELNAADWASKDESRIEEAKQRKRRTQYIANVLVIRDPANPENEGSVKLFKFGKKILDMIMSKAKPEFDDSDPVFVWDIDEGCNFKLRIKTVSNYPNYDSSEFAAQSALASTDEEMQEILDKCHRLSEFTDPARFKSYDDLKKAMDRALNGVPVSNAESKALAKATLNDVDFDLDAEVKRAAQPARKIEKSTVPVVEETDDDLEEFKKMLQNI